MGATIRTEGARIARARSASRLAILETFTPGAGLTSNWVTTGPVVVPTISPSILVRWDEGDEHKPQICHSYVRDGRIQFLGDCTHALAGKTVDLPEVT